MLTQALTRNHYDNCQIFSANGKLMFLCQERRLRWYVGKGLAKIVDDNPLTAKLLFKAKGLGRNGDLFFLTARMNHCVVCKTDQNLTRHHIMPYCYSKFFPPKAKIQSSYDIVLLCLEHHSNYEIHALKLKQEFAEKHNVPLNGVGPTVDHKAHKISGLKNALTTYRHQIPELKRQELLERLCFYIGKTITLDEVGKLPYIEWRLKPILLHGEAILLHHTDLDKFALIWRKHFVEIMDPKFMPEKWDINRRIYSEEC